jgi:phosphatidylserine/phosphatidylglycerophosphate/cardiolipin synthase-like enzyme
MKFLIPVFVVGAVIYLVHQGGFPSQVTNLLAGQTSSETTASTVTGAAHYSPGENLEALDSANIVNSKCDHLDLAMYSFTDWKLADAVTTFANRGHRVRIYRDREQYEQEAKRNNRVIAMFRGNRNISIRVKASSVLMHVKSWSDGCQLRDGSANWSPSGEKDQDNTLVLTSNPNAIAVFETKFDQMWGRPDNLQVQ